MVSAHLCLQGTFTVLGFISGPAEWSLQMCAKICAKFKSCAWGVWAALQCVMVRERRNSGQQNSSSIAHDSLSLCICGAPGECVFEIQTGVMALPQKPDTLLSTPGSTKPGQKYLCSPLLPACALRWARSTSVYPLLVAVCLLFLLYLTCRFRIR